VGSKAERTPQDTCEALSHANRALWLFYSICLFLSIFAFLHDYVMRFLPALYCQFTRMANSWAILSAQMLSCSALTVSNSCFYGLRRTSLKVFVVKWLLKQDAAERLDSWDGDVAESYGEITVGQVQDSSIYCHSLGFMDCNRVRHGDRELSSRAIDSASIEIALWSEN
jgi:hypothetical protein